MKMKKAFIIILSLLMVLSLAACSKGGGNSGGSGESKANIPNGYYKLIEMEEDGEAVAAEDLELMESMGLVIFLKINDDHTGYLNIFGEKTEVTFEESDIVIEDEKVPYTFDGTVISLEKDGSKMVFTETEPIDESEEIDISQFIEDAEVIDEEEIIADSETEEATDGAVEAEMEDTEETSEEASEEEEG